MLVRAAAAVTLLCALLSLSACGDDEKERRDGRHGGTLTMLAGADVDFLDPGHTYFAFGLNVALATQRPLYGYKPDDLSTPVADLA